MRFTAVDIIEDECKWPERFYGLNFFLMYFIQVKFQFIIKLIREILKPVPVVRFLMFNNLTPEQESKIYFTPHYHFINILTAIQIDNHINTVVISLFEERII